MDTGRYKQNNYKRLCQGSSYVYVFPSTNRHPVVFVFDDRAFAGIGGGGVGSPFTAPSSVSSMNAGIAT